MECRFVTNGLVIDYFGTVKPCCVFRYDQDYKSSNSIKKIDLVNWHQSDQIKQINEDLKQGRWPNGCQDCEYVEKQNRGDSIRLCGLNSYADYQDSDITLEIRGGSTCNFACQTCWPQASSRVAQYYRRAEIDFVEIHDMDWEFEVLDPIKHRLRNIVLLGGEPFYDKRCLRFLKWIKDQNLQTSLVIFTNGSVLDRDFIESYPGELVVVFSIDAIGKPFEYIRFGGSWDIVEENYRYCRSLPRVETRVNITTSPYNYHYLPDLLSWLVDDWPAVVSFGLADTVKNTHYMNESVFPKQQRTALIDRLNRSIETLENGNIEAMQKINAINAVRSIVNNLETLDYNPTYHQKLQEFVLTMDRIKSISIDDYCPEVAEYLDIRPGILDKASPTFFVSER